MMPTSNTPLPASEILALADAMADESRDPFERREAAEAYRAARASSPVTLEEAALVGILWHHQGAGSTIGQTIRKILGMGQFDRLTDEQLAIAKQFNPYARALAARKGGRR